MGGESLLFGVGLFQTEFFFKCPRTADRDKAKMKKEEEERKVSG